MEVLLDWQGTWPMCSWVRRSFPFLDFMHLYKEQTFCIFMHACDVNISVILSAHFLFSHSSFACSYFFLMFLLNILYKEPFLGIVCSLFHQFKNLISATYLFPWDNHFCWCHQCLRCSTHVPRQFQTIHEGIPQNCQENYCVLKSQWAWLVHLSIFQQAWYTTTLSTLLLPSNIPSVT